MELEKQTQFEATVNPRTIYNRWVQLSVEDGHVVTIERNLLPEKVKKGGSFKFEIKVKAEEVK